jgi:hypothetical protein
MCDRLGPRSPDIASTASAARSSGAYGFRVGRERYRGGYAFGFRRGGICDRLGPRSPDVASATPAAASAVGLGVGPDKPGLRLLTRESLGMGPVLLDGAHVLAPLTAQSADSPWEFASHRPSANHDR